jgi:hypothetical protein
MQTSDLDSIVEQSLRSFYEDISSSEWCGRENEMVNLYALGHLAKHVRSGTILSELTQIGIEMTVRQLPRLHHELKWMTVRKDLVIWPAPRMTLWKAEKPCNRIPSNEPLAVMEWKVNHFLNQAVHKQNLDAHDEHKGDIQWLRDTSCRNGMKDFIGYAVLVQDTKVPKVLSCVRVQAGVERSFLTLP